MVPDCRLCVRDFDLDNIGGFRANLYVRRSDGAIACVGKNISARHDLGQDSEHFGPGCVVLYFEKSFRVCRAFRACSVGS